MRPLPAAVAASLLAALAGCGGNDPADESVAATTSDASPATLPKSDERLDLDPADFTTEVTNHWFPLHPGTRWSYEETTEDGHEQRVVVTVTSVTRKVADGVTALVVRDTGSERGNVLEDTFDWYAQDSDGTVWYLGEQTAEFENGEVATREGSFEAGRDGAEAGVIMPAEPQPGMTYRQEYKKGEAEDHGEVLALGKEATVPADSYDGLLLTADTTPLEPDVLEQKYYAKDVGLVLTVDKESNGREELIEVTTVSPTEAHRAGTVPLGQPY